MTSNRLKSIMRSKQKTHRTVSIFAGLISIALICSCASPAVVGQGAAAHDVAAKVKVLSEMGYDIVETPAIPVSGFGAYYSIRMLADHTGALWQITYSSSKDLGDTATCVANGVSYSASLANYAAGFSTLHAYTATISPDVLRSSAKNEQHVTFSGNGTTVDLVIWPGLAGAFLDQAWPLAERWVTQDQVFIDGVIARASARMTEERDNYKKITWINTGKYTTTDNGVNYELYASLMDGGDVMFYLKVSSARSYYEGWAFYNKVIDIDSNQFELFRRSEVGYGGKTFEWLHIPLSRAYLERHRKTGLDMKVYGDRDSVIVQVPGWVVETLLRKIDARMTSI